MKSLNCHLTEMLLSTKFNLSLMKRLQIINMLQHRHYLGHIEIHSLQHI